jgi:ATP-binding cassette subfamily B protein
LHAKFTALKTNINEKQKRWQWERIQVKLFKISVKGLALGQVQQVGSVFFNQSGNEYLYCCYRI